jgi:hypothetical protein
MKADGDLATMIGWNAEAFARTKRMKPIADYLKPTKPKSADTAALDVRRMFERMMTMQGDG